MPDSGSWQGSKREPIVPIPATNASDTAPVGHWAGGPMVTNALRPFPPR